jgi:hypothetical protein
MSDALKCIKHFGAVYALTKSECRGSGRGYLISANQIWSVSLCLTKHHAMRTYWGSGGIATHILDLGTRWRWVVSFTIRQLYPQKKVPGTHWIGGWVGPRAVLDMVVKRKIPIHRWESNPRTPIVQPVAQRYTDWANTALVKSPFEYKIW